MLFHVLLVASCFPNRVVKTVILTDECSLPPACACMQDGVKVHVLHINPESMITALQVCIIK